MSMYNALKSAYHTILPAKLRTFLFQNRLARIPRGWVLRKVESLARDEEIYTDDYFRTVVDPTSATSAPAMAQSIVSHVRPDTAIDVGCGTGQLMMAMQRLGVSVRGLEFAKPALAICRERGLHVEPFDIEQAEFVDWKADLVVSTEVAEHLPARCADRYVDLLSGMAPTVFITAAVPGTGGTDHANEQPNEYWIEKFQRRGYDFISEPSYRWRAEWKSAGVQSWYCQSAMLFERRV